MCGILGIWFRESVPDFEVVDYLFKEAEVRGQSGIGAIIIKPYSDDYFAFKSPYPYSQATGFRGWYETHAKKNDILLGICRNAPETENITNKENYHNTLQPIVYRNISLVHNGAISSTCVEEYFPRLDHNIDSEVIARAYYRYNKNLKQALEHINGGWSFILYDDESKRLKIGSSFIPLAHGYIRGVGYFVHSSVEAIQEAFSRMRNSDRSRLTAVWEDYYSNEVKEYSIHDIDIDSGLIREYSYKHKFIHPVWKQDDKKGSVAIVLASGGIDSTCSLILFKHLLKQDVIAVNIAYGQRSEEAEKIAVKKICETLGIKSMFIDLRNFMSLFSDSSMLTNENIPIRTGMNVKTTQSWVPNRNGLFLNIGLTIAEHLILSNEYSRAIICGGFPNISEESVFPDNSGRFIKSFLKTAKFSTLSGAQNRIEYSNITAGLTKTEELVVFKHYGYEELFGYTVSCDRAIVKDGQVYQCWKGDYPACGSGKLSWWAAKKAGIKDTRKYYEVDDANYKHYVPKYIESGDTGEVPDFSEIVGRLKM